MAAVTSILRHACHLLPRQDFVSSIFGVPTRSQQLIAVNKNGGSVLTPGFMQEFLQLTDVRCSWVEPRTRWLPLPAPLRPAAGDLQHFDTG